MVNKSKIEWTEATWNPSVGCSKISEGCKYCYAETFAKRLQAMGLKDYEYGFKFRILPHRLNEPLKRKKPTLFFVNSMSDLFHEEMPLDFLDEVFEVIESTPHHTYQILTKRAEKMYDYLKNKYIPKNIWLGVTVENKKRKNRIEYLKKLNATVRFISFEPLLNDVGELNLEGINWVIVGGESGKKARPMKENWVLNIKKYCDYYNVPFFFKQWGTWGPDGIKRSKKRNGRILNGKIYNEYPKMSENLV